MFTGSGRADHSRWSQVKGCISDPAPICFKYPSEYERSISGCGLPGNPRDRVSTPEWSAGFYRDGVWRSNVSDIWAEGKVKARLPDRLAPKSQRSGRTPGAGRPPPLRAAWR